MVWRPNSLPLPFRTPATRASLLLVFFLAPRGFSPGTPVFPSRQKPTFPNSNSTRNQVDEEPLLDVLPANIYLFKDETPLFLGLRWPI